MEGSGTTLNESVEEAPLPSWVKMFAPMGDAANPILPVGSVPGQTHPVTPTPPVVALQRDREVPAVGLLTEARFGNKRTAN